MDHDKYVSMGQKILEQQSEIAALRRVLGKIADDCEELARTWTPDHPEITRAEARTWGAVGKIARAALLQES